MIPLLHCPSTWPFTQDLLKEGSKSCAPHHLGILLVYHLQVNLRDTLTPAIRQCWSDAKTVAILLLSLSINPCFTWPFPSNSDVPNTALFCTSLFQVMKALDDLKQFPTQNVEDLDEAKCLASLHTVYSMTLTPAGVATSTQTCRYMLRCC